MCRVTHASLPAEALGAWDVAGAGTLKPVQAVGAQADSEGQQQAAIGQVQGGPGRLGGGLETPQPLTPQSEQSPLRQAGAPLHTPAEPWAPRRSQRWADEEDAAELSEACVCQELPTWQTNHNQ